MEAGINRPVTIAIGLAVVAVHRSGLGWSLAPRDTPEVPPGLTEVKEPAELSEVDRVEPPNIVTSTNYLGHRIYTVKATLRNISSPIRLVDVKLTSGILRERRFKKKIHPAFERKQPPIEPGTEYRFEIPFENPPRNGTTMFRIRRLSGSR